MHPTPSMQDNTATQIARRIVHSSPATEND